MGFISVSGTGCAALILALASSAIPAHAANNATLELSLTGLRSQKGNVLVCISANPKFFPKTCDKDPASIKVRVASGQATRITVPDMPPGTYALAIIHDENSNNKMDMKAILPAEGFGFSRNPRIMFGPPSFKAAAFTVAAGGNSLTVKIGYML
jgi:uncharacterized protein (DUF2141 family)